MDKQVKDIKILETTDKDVAIAFWFTDGTKQIIVMTVRAAEDLINSIEEKL